MKLALVGAGAFSDFCLSNYKKFIPDVKVIAVFDMEHSRAEGFAKTHDIPLVAKSMDELLAQPSDAVVILTPPNTHWELGKQAIEANKHVLVEKPIAFTNEQAESLVELAKKNNRQITSNLVLRYHPFHKELRSSVRYSNYGKLLTIKTTANLAKYPAGHWYWNKDISGGFFLNTYTHFFDLYRFISGQEVETAQNTPIGDIGHRVKLKLTSCTAELVTNLHVSNENELVETIFQFERASIKTVGWFPDSIIITQADGSKIKKSDTRTKKEHYGNILATILSDLVNQPQDKTISINDLREAVRVALLAQENSS